MVAVCSATVGGNALVVRALLRSGARAPAHYLLASLAMADLLLGLTVLPISAAEEMAVFNIDGGWCAWWRALDVFCCTASILSLCALGWERHAGVTRPLERARRSAQARLVALLVWPVAVVVAAPAALVPFTSHHHPGEVPRACVVNTNIEYVMLSITMSFYLPALVTLGLYWRVVRALRALPPLRAHRGGSREPQPASPVWISPFCKNRSPTIEPNQLANPTIYLSPKGTHLGTPWTPWAYLGDVFSPVSARCNSPLHNHDQSDECRGPSRQVRATRTIVLLMSLFLISWTPFFIILPIDAVCACVSQTALWCATWLGYANSALNPLVYAATSPALRRALSVSSTRSSDARLLSPAKFTPTHRRTNTPDIVRVSR